MSDHRARYKNSALDSKELRRRREEDSFQLRKQKRDDILFKKRTIESVSQVEDESQPTVGFSNGGDNLSDLESQHLGLGQLQNQDKDAIITDSVIQALMQDNDTETIINNARKIRTILSREPQPPFDDVIQKGLIPRFVQLLDRSDETMIQFEVAWILTNICSGTTEQTRCVVESGAVPKLVQLLATSDIKVCEQAVWALGNIVGDNAEFRDLVISHNFVPALLSLIKPDIPIGFLRNQTWVLVNLCRNKEPPTDIDVIKQLIPALHYLILSTDLAILIDTTWAISYITDLGPEYSQLIIDSGSVNRMIPLLSNNEIKIQTAAIRALGSIVSGSDTQTQSVIDAGALPHVKRILENNKDRIVKEALWFVSNITAGSTEQVQAVIDNGLIPAVIHHLSKGQFTQQKEAAWTIFNMCLSGTSKQLQVLIDENVIAPLCNLLTIQDSNVVRNILESISTLLNCCSETNPEILELIEECGGLDKIESLQNDENPEIYNFASSIIEQHFQEDIEFGQ